MKAIRDALLRMYRSAKELKIVSEGLKKIGMGDEPIFDAYGNVVDAIYYTIGEEKPYNESVTNLVVEHMMPEEEYAADILMNEWKKNHSIPAPQLMCRDQVYELYLKNGGYFHDAPKATPEGEWK